MWSVQISDTFRRLPKNGYAIIEVEQTVPLGCTYTNTEEEVCEETLSPVDINRETDACKAGIHVMNADNNKTSFHTIKVRNNNITHIYLTVGAHYSLQVINELLTS
jgi:hypothetical protein